MRATVVSAFFVLIVSSAPSAQADLYLRYLHNNSSSTVKIDARTPSYWTGLPKYPISVKSHHSVFDVSLRDQALYKLCRKEISNVAVPEDCADNNPSNYLSISFPARKVYYRISTCNYQIREFRRKSKNNWPLIYSYNIMGQRPGAIYYLDVSTDENHSITTKGSSFAIGPGAIRQTDDRYWHRYVGRR